jgi:hypothetical protein
MKNAPNEETLYKHFYLVKRNRIDWIEEKDYSIIEEGSVSSTAFILRGV